MSKSNIVLAIIAGAAIGGIVALVIKAQNALQTGEDDEEPEASGFELIAGKFSDMISSDLKKAEQKIRSTVKKDTASGATEGEFGIFL